MSEDFQASQLLSEVKKQILETVKKAEDETFVLKTLASVLNLCANFLSNYDNAVETTVNPKLCDTLQKIRHCRLECIEKLESMFDVKISKPLGPNSVNQNKEETEDDEKHLEQRVMECMIECTERWSDIAGSQKAKNCFMEAVIYPKKYPEYFKGIRSPWKTILLYGPPGTGKTVLAKASALEASCKFFMITVSTIASKFLGEGERIVKLLFKSAVEHSPCIIFWDEIDSVCSERGGNNEHESSRKIKTEILTQLDMVKNLMEAQKCQVTFVCASNFPWALDGAFMRRIEKQLYIPLPTIAQIVEILKIILKDTSVDSGVDLTELAKQFQGFSGADIKRVCRDAAMEHFRQVMSRIDDNSGDNSVNEMLNVPISMNDFSDALARTKCSVPSSSIQKYEQWCKKNDGK